jgi:hypothetical protein
MTDTPETPPLGSFVEWQEEVYVVTGGQVIDGDVVLELSCAKQEAAGYTTRQANALDTKFLHAGLEPGMTLANHPALRVHFVNYSTFSVGFNSKGMDRAEVCTLQQFYYRWLEPPPLFKGRIDLGGAAFTCEVASKDIRKAATVFAKFAAKELDMRLGDGQVVEIQLTDAKGKTYDVKLKSRVSRNFRFTSYTEASPK